MNKIREIVTRLKKLWAISKAYDRQLGANAKAVQFVDKRISDHICSVNLRLQDYQLRPRKESEPMTTHRFSTPEGIEIIVEIQEEGWEDGIQYLNFTVEAQVPGYRATAMNLPPWKHTLDIRAHRPKGARGV